MKQGFHITATKGSWVKNEVIECTARIVFECGHCDKMFGVDQRFNSKIMMLM